MTREHHRLGLEIIVTLAFKAALLTAIYYVCFGPSHQIKLDSRQVESHLLAGAGQP